MREKIMRFMQGRYGMDRFSRFLIWAALILCLFSYISNWGILYYVSLAIIIYSYFRIFSKNYSKRYEENLAYERMIYKVKNIFSRKKQTLKQAKDYHIYRCPKCKQKIRIPRGKGRISITCPKCRTEFIKRS